MDLVLQPEVLLLELPRGVYCAPRAPVGSAVPPLLLLLLLLLPPSDGAGSGTYWLPTFAPHRRLQRGGLCGGGVAGSDSPFTVRSRRSFPAGGAPCPCPSP